MVGEKKDGGKKAWRNAEVTYKRMEGARHGCMDGDREGGIVGLREERKDEGGSNGKTEKEREG